MSVSFTVCLAGFPIEINCLFEQTKQFCSDYLTEEAPLFSVTAGQEEIEYERLKSAQEDAFEGIPVRSFPDSYLETLAVYRQIAARLPQYDTLLFHGSVVAMEDCAYLFTAKSGTGKSTHTRLWREVFGSRAYMVNDDKPLLRIQDGIVYACGTPWDGKHRLSTNAMVPLRGLCILERDSSNHIEPISLREAFPMLFQQSYRPTEPAQLVRVLNLLDRISQTVPLYRMGCTIDPEAARMAYRCMHK